MVCYGVARRLPVDEFMSEAWQSWQMAQTNGQYHSASSITFLCGPKHSVSTQKALALLAKVKYYNLNLSRLSDKQTKWLSASIFRFLCWPKDGEKYFWWRHGVLRLASCCHIHISSLSELANGPNKWAITFSKQYQYISLLAKTLCFHSRDCSFVKLWRAGAAVAVVCVMV